MEVMIASAYIFVFSCIAFALIAAAGLGFQVKSEAGPFAYPLYAVIELLKAGPLVDYYDLFASQLPFDRMSDVRHADLGAKSAVLAYRIVLNLFYLPFSSVSLI